MRMGCTRGCHDLFASGIGHAIGNVVCNGAKEQEGFLQDQANVPAVVGHFELLDVHAIQGNAAF